MAEPHTCPDCGAVFDMSRIPAGAVILRMDCDHAGRKGIQYVYNGNKSMKVGARQVAVTEVGTLKRARLGPDPAEFEGQAPTMAAIKPRCETCRHWGKPGRFSGMAICEEQARRYEVSHYFPPDFGCILHETAGSEKDR